MNARSEPFALRIRLLLPRATVHEARVIKQLLPKQVTKQNAERTQMRTNRLSRATRYMGLAACLLTLTLSSVNCTTTPPGEESFRDVCDRVSNRTVSADSQQECSESGGEWLAGEATANCYCPGTAF